MVLVERRITLFRHLIASARMGLDMQYASGSVSGTEAETAAELLDAMAEGRFYFASEPWHGTKSDKMARNYPSELLLRAETSDGQPIKPFTPVTILSHAGLQSRFDKAIILSAVDQALAKKQMPVSINTSARNMSDSRFWQDVSQFLHDNFTKEEIYGQLTFEITEDDLAHGACRDVLLTMKRDLGCTFAIDDFYHDRAMHIRTASGVDSGDWTRLENLRDIVDYVKIDGDTVEASLAKRNPFDLEDLVGRIKAVVPEAKIILERIQNADQAHALKHFSDAVQGLKLTSDRSAFQKELFRAARNFPPRPAYL